MNKVPPRLIGGMGFAREDDLNGRHRLWSSCFEAFEVAKQ